MARPTISDVARLAGVSKKTVSFVLNGRGGASAETCARVNEAIAALGFVPSLQARALASGTNALVVLLHDHGPDGEGWLMPAIRGAERALAGTPLLLAVHALADGAAGLRRLIEAQRPRALVLLPPLSAQPVLAALARELGTPCVRLSPLADGDPATVVSSHDRQAAADAAHYLMALGHRRIGFICGPEEDIAAHERERGFADALGDDAGLVAQGDGSFTSGREAALLLLELSPRPTAILAASPAMAAGALAAARAAGLAVPDALSIMAVEDADHAEQLVPPLAAMRLPKEQLAEAAVRKALDPEGAARVPARFYAELAPRASAGASPDQSG